MSIRPSIVTQYSSCVTSLTSAQDLERWMLQPKNDSDSTRDLYLLYIYRPTCPYCKAFEATISRLVSILCFIVGKMTDSRQLHIAQVEKSVILESPKTAELAPTVPALLSARSGHRWNRLPKGDLNRTPTRLLQFLADTWAIDDLRPVTSTPQFASADEIESTSRAVLVDYLPERDFPPTPALKTRGTKPPSAPSQQTHDALFHFATSSKNKDTSGGFVLVNRLFLPKEHEFALDIDPDRAQVEPIMVDLRENKTIAKGADVLSLL